MYHPLCMFGESVFALIPDERAQKSPEHLCTETSWRHNHVNLVPTYTSLWRMESRLAKRW